MFIGILLLIVCSLLVIFFKNIIATILHAFVYLHHQLMMWLGTVLSHGQTGRVVQALLGLILIPLFFGLLVGFVTWLMSRRVMPYAMMTAWIVWVVLVVVMLAR